MTLISIEPPLGFTTASTITHSASTIGEIKGRLSSQWAALSANWQGSSKGRIEADVTSALALAARLAERARALGAKLEAIAEHFEEADENVASVVPTPEWVWTETVSAGGLSFAALATRSGFGALLAKYPVKPPPAPQPKPPAKKPPPPAKPPPKAPVKQPAKPKYVKDFPARAKDDTFLVGQEKNDSCTIASTRMALKQVTGVDYKESDLRKVSSKIDDGYERNPNKWGTSPDTTAKLINDNYGKSAKASYTNPGTQSITDLQSAAKDGKGIIVSVRNSEWFGSSAAHSVTVVGVKTENGQQVVLVNDPWPPNTGKKLGIPADDFKRAWYGDATYVSKVK